MFNIFYLYYIIYLDSFLYCRRGEDKNVIKESHLSFLLFLDIVEGNFFFRFPAFLSLQIVANQ